MQIIIIFILIGIACLSFGVRLLQAVAKSNVKKIHSNDFASGILLIVMSILTFSFSIYHLIYTI